MDKTSIALVFIALTIAFTLYGCKDTQTSYMQTNEYKERIAEYRPIEFDFGYVEPIKCILRDRTLIIKFWKREI